MNVKKSIVILSVIAVFIILMAVFSLVSFEVAGTVYDYNGFAKTIKLGLDLSGGVSAVYYVQPDGYDDLEGRVDGTVASMQDLLVSEGYPESTVTKSSNGDSFSIRVEVPDVDDPEEVLDLIGRPAKLEFTAENYGDTLPEDATVYIEGSRHLQSAYVTIDSSTGDFAVALTFNDAGTEVFRQLTTDYLNKQVYIYVNGEFYSALTINATITDGNAIITNSSWTGSSGYQQASDFATRLQSGAFGVTLEVGEVRNISATLGENALLAAIIAGAVGVALIFIFMGGVYRGLGLAADIALVVYILLLLWFCAVLPWVQLTLPGIAGIILSIGMAVDANIIICERVRDEYMKSSKSIKSSIKEGFKRSMAAIFDGNITTIIGAVVLWIIGSASIVGFAVTLFIGIILSMFTSLVVTRIIVNCFLAFNATSEKFYGIRRAREEERRELPSFIKGDAPKSSRKNVSAASDAAKEAN